ncbi:clarin-3 [Dromiciops gliroides]|uniref:clarin-3 n=1 Tax=Dromiciops gliroides TaxID=33562 RepID=UPI001CC58B1E|nr:clarin-3 [Dromiciops gliroides]
MPTIQKTLMFAMGFVTSLASFATVCAVLGLPEWVTGKIEFRDSSFTNGTILVTYGLFRGMSTQELNSGLAESDLVFEVLKILPNSSRKSLHSVVIVLLFLSLFTSLLSSGLTFFNSISNPYQTWLGPTSIFVWNGLNMAFVLVAMILFVVNTQANGLSVALSSLLYSSQGNIYGSTTHIYGYVFWLMIPILLFNSITILLITVYQNLRYHRKQEHRKPMENAPKDGILF